MRTRTVFGVTLLLALLTVIAIAQEDVTTGFAPVEELTIEVLNTYPHDTDAFTQGLLVGEDGLLYESTGRYGQSTLRAVEPESGEVLRRFDLPEEIFAEGLALVDDQLYQITWREQIAVVYDLETGADADTFEPLGTFGYTGEGWGLCYDGESLYMSDGSGSITVRDPETFQPIAQYPVTLYGVFVDEINELECVDDEVYANIWNSDTIIRFDKQTGVVNAVIDGSNLLPPEVRTTYSGGAVLNGIAYNPESDTFYVTGKLWESLFEVNFVPANPS
jgi:glutamine cyclotransferase